MGTVNAPRGNRPRPREVAPLRPDPECSFRQLLHFNNPAYQGVFALVWGHIPGARILLQAMKVTT